MVRDYVARKTLGLRHFIGRRMMPQVYNQWLTGRIYDYRPMIDFSKEHFWRIKDGGSGLVGVEIGVFEGANALHILQVLPMKKLYLVDPYIAYADSDEHVIPSSAARRAKKLVQERFATFKEVEFIFSTSEEAASQIPNDVDIVYIDGNHEYEFVRKDFSLYFEKVRLHGVIGGHDYGDVNFKDVKRAVDQFVSQNNLALQTQFPDWWVVK